jgi:hypothetical protein
MFEARQCSNDSAWYVRDGLRANTKYLLTDGTVWHVSAVLEIPERIFYPTREAALAAIHAHYHGGDTETIEPGDIAATLREEGE